MFRRKDWPPLNGGGSVGGKGRPAEFQDLNDFIPDLVEGQNFIRQSRPGHEPRHAPNDAAFLILHQNLSPRFLNMFAANEPILAHPR